MKTFASIQINTFKNIDSARSAAFRKKKAAEAAGWTNVKTVTVKKDGVEETIDVIGERVAEQPKPEQETPAVPQKATKKKPTPEAPKAEATDTKPRLSKSSDKTNRDGLPRISTGKSGPRPVGQTTGVGVEQTWGIIFEREEKKAPEKRISDADISTEMAKQFPGRNSRVFARVAEVRTKWRKGLFGYQKRGQSASEA